MARQRHVCPNGCTDEMKEHGPQRIIGERLPNGEANWLWCNVCGDEPVPESEVQP